MRDHLDNRSFGTAYGTITILYGLGSFSAALIAGVIADWRGSFDLVYVLLAMMAGLSSIMALVRFRMLASKGASRPSLSGQL